MAFRKEKQSLSKGVLQMKFMQRTAVQQLVDENEAQLIDEEHWYLAVPKEFKMKGKPQIIEESFQPLLGLRFGRQSFKGFNPEIERLATNINKDQDLAESEKKEQEASVSDEEMAERYASLVGTIGKKFQKKKRQKKQESKEDEEEEEVEREPKKKRKFLKPKD
ncbi:hypothetical protein CAPTEDRAFT_148512 [Capitella teleta]|uniref:M-phase phosphoprotein 6 n=1 Tax=Capitella teleta TaxID=283909 RepID=R7TY45_CAPTE|nr:hypothetical protein CAPTEDRAFT_148512 [Capitella teleta]|eukprot:ELT98674.1 hypothetical protein CAPTEDRAFT_148512 [Capitella teleta]